MANHPTTQVQVVVHGGLTPLLELATSTDVDSQRHALMALTNLIANESNHNLVVKQGGLGTLLALVQSPDPDVREYVSEKKSLLCVQFQLPLLSAFYIILVSGTLQN